MKAAMCFLAAIVVLVLSTFVLKILWVVRMGTLAHWSYLIGCAFYPQNASRSMILTMGVFSFVILGSLVPNALFPRVKLVATAMSVPPQMHMLFLLHRQVSRRIDNDTVTKSVQAYTALTLITTVWTIFTLIWNHQSARRRRLRRLNADQSNSRQLQQEQEDLNQTQGMSLYS